MTDGKHLAFSTVQGEVFVLHVPTFQTVVQYHHPGGTLTTLSLNSTGQYLFSAGKDHRVLLYHLQDRMLSLLYDKTRLAYLTFGHDETYIVGVSIDGYLALLEYLSPVDNQQLAYQQVDFMDRCIWGSNQKFFITIHNQQVCARICKWDDTLHFTKIIDVPYEGEVTTAIVSANARLLAMGSTNQMVCIWSTQTGERIVMLPHPDKVEALAFNGDSTHIATWCSDGNIRVWNTATGHSIAQFYNAETFPQILFSADDKYIITCTKTGTLTGTCWKPKDFLVLAEEK